MGKKELRSALSQLNTIPEAEPCVLLATGQVCGRGL